MSRIEIFSWIKIYIRTTLLGKIGRMMHLKFLFLINNILLAARFVFHPKKMAKSYGSVLLKTFITMKKLAQDPGHTKFLCSVNDDQ